MMEITSFILAQIVGGVGTIFNVISMLLKSKRKILITLLFSFVFVGVQYILLNAYVGAAISIVSVIELIISYNYEKKEKDLPKIFSVYYMLFTAVVISITYFILHLLNINITFGIADIFAIIAAITFSISICFEKKVTIKSLVTLSNVFWLIYAIIIQAYAAIISLGIIVVSGIIGICNEVKEIKNTK